MNFKLSERPSDRPGTAARTTVTAARDVTTVEVVAEIDLRVVHGLRASLDEALSAASRALVVDLRGVTFCSASGLGLLAHLHRAAGEAGVPYVLVANQTALLRPIRVFRMDRMLCVVPTVEEALDWLTFRHGITTSLRVPEPRR